MEKLERGVPGILYRDLLIACEKIGDHVINVSESIYMINNDEEAA